VTNLFKGMMRPLATAASTVGRYAVPPLALASAAGEIANIGQQAGKPEGQRDLTSMGLSGLNVLCAGMSLFPPTAPVGIPLAIGSGLAQALRDNPELIEKIRSRVGDMPYSDPMTGYMAP
tara:strand:- start:466 stop:825 length:360 start_codon:yes stop_codon:yes gene_type:complete